MEKGFFFLKKQRSEYYTSDEVKIFSLHQVPCSEIQSRTVNIHPCSRAERSCRANPGNKVTLNKKVLQVSHAYEAGWA